VEIGHVGTGEIGGKAGREIVNGNRDNGNRDNGNRDRRDVSQTGVRASEPGKRPHLPPICPLRLSPSVPPEQYPASLKAKVAVEAIKGQKTAN